VDTRVPAVCFIAVRASRGSSWRPCQRPARHIPLRFPGELLSSYARGREAFLAASLLRKFASDERDRCLAGQSVVHEGDEGLVYRPLILSHPWTIQVEPPIHQVEVWHVGLDVLQDCIARLDPGQYNEDVRTGTTTLSNPTGRGRITSSGIWNRSSQTHLLWPHSWYDRFARYTLGLERREEA